MKKKRTGALFGLLPAASVMPIAVPSAAVGLGVKSRYPAVALPKLQIVAVGLSCWDSHFYRHDKTETAYRGGLKPQLE
jgi:hypothetical protein